MTLFLQAAKDLWRRQDSFWLRLFGLLIFCTGLATFVAASQTVEVTAKTDLSEHWRGAYDLLVRPASAIPAVEARTGVVEGNYLGTPAGGITRQELDLIRGLSDVEVAAPVSAIGFLLNKTGTVVLEMDPVASNHLYQINLEMTLPQGAGDPQSLDRRTAFFAAPDGLSGWFTQNIQTTVGTPGGKGVDLLVGELPPLWTLVAGIDPEAEAALIGLDQTLVSGSYLPAREALAETYDKFSDQARKAASIPVLVNRRSFLNLDVSLRVRALALDLPEQQRLFGNQAEADGVLAELGPHLQAKEGELLLQETARLDSLLSPLAKLSLYFRPGKPVQASPYGGFSDLNRNLLLYPGSVHYLLRPAPKAEPERLSLEAIAQGKWADIAPQITSLGALRGATFPVNVPAEATLFRPIDVTVPPAFVLSVRGAYDFQRLGLPQDPLAYVPLGIYEPPLATLRYDAAGNRVTPQVMTPDLNPAGFILRPPLALTTLEGARYLRAREDFIDAVRVRVRGISAYTPDSVARVEQVAAEIAERTGLHVDIVAGASPQKILVEVPGLGVVEEPWTTLGAAVHVSKGLNTANLTLLGVLLVATGLFLANLSQVAILARREEVGLLLAVGWRASQVTGLLFSGALLNGLLAALVAALASLALSLALGLRISWPAILAVSGMAPLVYSATALPPIRRAISQLPALTLGQGEVALGVISRLPTPLTHLGLALRQIWRRRARAVLSILVMAIGGGLALTLLAVIVDLQSHLRVTLLGEFIALNVRP
ncbi:MAG: hypothetical protein PHQ40_15335, partial [Anaerolineaceae bacterium]|nr:hypothetical protein [Anaerolineaceae bacterium]